MNFLLEILGNLTELNSDHLLSNDPLYESVSAGRKYQGLEHWLPLFYEKLDTFFSYFPSATVTMYRISKRISLHVAS